MIGTVIAVLVVAIVVVLVGGGIWWAIVSRRRKNAATLAAMSPEEREVHDAQLDYDASVKQAGKAVALATKAYDRGVQGGERALSSAEKSGQRRLGSYHGKDGNITLFEDRITYNSRSFRLDPSFRASADTAGHLVAKSRSTLTRMATGGLLLGPVGLVAGVAARKTKVQDGRELYLLVESDEFSAALTCKAEDGAKVRQFAALIVTTAKQAAAVAEQREQAITVVRQNLEWARKLPVTKLRPRTC